MHFHYKLIFLYFQKKEVSKEFDSTFCLYIIFDTGQRDKECAIEDQRNTIVPKGFKNAIIRI